MKSNNDPDNLPADHECDNLPADHECDDVPADEAFVHAVMARVGRHRRCRRVVIGVAGGLAGAIACTALTVLPAPAISRLPLGAFNIFASLVLATLCGMAWIASEDTTSA